MSKKNIYVERKSRIRSLGRHSYEEPLKGPSLSYTHAELTDEWKNRGPENPHNITAGSGLIVTWKHRLCSKSFKASVNRRARAIDEGSESEGCKFCSGSYLRLKNEPELLAPDLLDECVEEKNLTPKAELLCNSRELRLWQCSLCGHKYRTKIQARLGVKPYKTEQNCPVCFEDERVNIEDSKLLDHFKRTKKNQGFDYRSLPVNYCVYWSCRKKKHLQYLSYQQQIERKSCSACTRESRKFLSDYKELAQQFVEALRYPQRRPEKIRDGSWIVAIWQCPVSEDHTWRSAVMRRTKDGRGCPFCANRRLSSTNSFASCAPELAAEWDYRKNEVSPDSIKSGDRHKYWFLCAEGHEYSASAWERTHRNVGCRLCQAENKCLARSHPWTLDEWHFEKNKQISIWNITYGSQKRVWWQCSAADDHIYLRSPYDRIKRKQGCSFCNNQKVSSTNSIVAVIPELARQFDCAINALEASEVKACDKKQYRWKCRCGASYTRSPKYIVKYGADCNECRRMKDKSNHVFENCIATI